MTIYLLGSVVQATECSTNRFFDLSRQFTDLRKANSDPYLRFATLSEWKATLVDNMDPVCNEALRLHYSLQGSFKENAQQLIKSHVAKAQRLQARLDVRAVHYKKTSLAKLAIKNQKLLTGFGFESRQAARFNSNATTAANEDFQNDLARSSGITQSQCLPVDLRPKLPRVRHQGGSSWCTRMVMADIFSAELGQPVSAASLAVGQILDGDGPSADSDKNVSIGFRAGTTGTQAFHAAVKNGYCLEKDMPSSLDIETLSGDLINLYSDIYRLKQRQQESGFTDETCTPLDSSLMALFPTQTQNVAELVEVIANSKEGSLIETLFENCRQPSKIKAQRLDYVAFKSFEDLDSKIDALNARLSKGKVVGSIIPSPGLKNVEDSYSLDGFHEIAIVGRRWNSKTKSCQYLVRNSYGNSDNNGDFENEEGHYWMEALPLLDFTNRFISLK